MYRHAWATAPDGAKTVKIFQISIKWAEKAHPLLTSVLYHSVLNGRLCLALLDQQCVSSPSPCMYQSSAHLPTWTGCELHRMLAAMEHTHSSRESTWHFTVYSKLYKTHCQHICRHVCAPAASYFHMSLCDWSNAFWSALKQLRDEN